MKLVLASLAALAIATPALAQSASDDSSKGFSASLGYSHWAADDGDLGAVTLRGRYMFNNYVGGELEASTGVKDETVYGVDLGIDTSFGGFAVVGAPLNDRFDVFARLGYATTSFDASGYGYNGSADIDGVAYGVGANFFFTEKFGIRGDFTKYDGGDQVAGEADVYSIAGVFRF
jgi:outer membrane immunogenic protein